MNKDDVLLQLIAICEVQVILANRKSQKLRVYEDMLERIKRLIVEHPS